MKCPNEQAADLPALKRAFDAALKKHRAADAREKIVAAKDRRKAQLEAVADAVDVDPETGEVI